jgi:multidrug efflux pump subunit AcrA (membrane-fusion protein)
VYRSSHRIGVVLDNLTARLQALLRQGGGSSSGMEQTMSVDSSPGSSREAELQALLATLEQRVASETATSRAEIARLQTDQAKRDADHRTAIAERERTSALQAAAVDESIRRLESDKAHISERLVRDHGRGPCCVTEECAAAVSHRAQSDVPGDAVPSGECNTCAAAAAPEEGQPSATIILRRRRATYFCSNGRACYCDACWTTKVRRRREVGARGCVECV